MDSENILTGLSFKNSIKTSNCVVGFRVALRIAESLDDAVDREVQKDTGARFQVRHFGAGQSAFSLVIVPKAYVNGRPAICLRACLRWLGRPSRARR